MFPKTLEAARTTLAGITAAIALFAVAGVKVNAAPQGTLLLHQLSSAAMRADSVGRTDAAQQINIAIALHLRNEQDLDAEIQSLYDPTSPNYHKFLSSDEFDAKYAPTQADYNAVIAYAAKNGLTVTGTHANRQVIDFSAPASTVENTFNVQLFNKVRADGSHFYAADSDPLVPNELAGSIQAVVGLDTAGKLHPQLRALTSLGLDQDTPRAGTGPNGLLVPSDIAKLYNLSNVRQDGTGQTLALFELDGYTASDIQMYETQYGLPNVTLDNVLLDGWSGGPGTDGGNAEVTLDIELMAAIAPKATEIIVYEAPNSGQSILDEYARIASDNLAKTVSTSWGLCENDFSPSFEQAEQNSFKQMAAQGQTIFAAAGDSGAFDNANTPTVPAVDDPASQPYVCGVGGTTLNSSSTSGYPGEITWGPVRLACTQGGGGGESTVWPKPSYQHGLGLSTTMRDVPDVSLDADPNTGYVIAVNGGWYGFGGTSCAAPLWAGFTALVNQARAANGQSTVGYINPILYSLGQTGSYFNDFHDIADNSMNRYYPAIPGYDDATGWGTFNGANLLADLSSGASFTPAAPAAPTNVAAAVGSSSTAVTWHASTGATKYNILSGASATGRFFLLGTSTTTSYSDTTAGSGSTYYYVVSAQNANGISGLSGPSNTTTGSGSNAPTGMTVTAIGLSSVNPSWNPVPNASYYYVGQATKSGGPYTVVGSPPTNQTTTQNLKQATKYYFVMAANIGGTTTNAGVQTPWSNEVAATTLLDSPGNNISCAPNSAATGIVVTWGSVAAATGYTLKRSLSGSGPFTAVTTTTTALTYTDTSIQPGVTEWYLVDATANGVTSYDSRIVETSAGCATPKSLVANYNQSLGQVYLVCSTCAGSTSFNFLRSTTSGGPYTKVGTSPNNGYYDKSYSPGTTYYYVAQSVNGSYTSPNSNQASALTAPAAPTGLSGTASTSGVALRWTAPVGTGLTYYISEARSSSGPWAQAGTSTSTTFLDSGIARGVTEYYEVYAGNSAGESPASNKISVATAPAAPTRPVAPALVQSGKSVVATWSAQTGVTSYTLYRGTAPSYNYTAIATQSTTTFTDTTTALGSTYTYYLAVTGPGGTTGNGLPSTITLTVPTPVDVTVSSTTSSSATIKWNAVLGATSYAVQYSLTSGGPYTAGGTATTTSTTVSGLTGGKHYYFVVIASAGSVNSAKSSEASAVLPLSAPTGVTVTSVAFNASAGSVGLRWTAVPGAASYNVACSFNSGGPYVNGLAGSSSSTTSATVSGFAAGKTVYCVVTAYASGVSSPNSSQVSGTIPVPAPTGLNASATSSSAVILSWNASSGATSYTVYRSLSATSGFASAGTSSTTTFSNSGLSASTKYYYYVTASVGSVVSPASSTTNTTTLVAPSTAHHS